MRVLHWYPDFADEGAIAKAVLGLTRAQLRLGVEVAIACARNESDGPQANYRLPGVTYFPWEPEAQVSLGGIVARKPSRGALSQLQNYRPDIVHIHGEFHPDNLFVPFVFDCPLVLSPRGAFHPVVFAKNRRLFKQLYFRLAKRVLYRRVGAFHALCPAEQEYIRRRLPESKTYCVVQGPNVWVEEGIEAAAPDAVAADTDVVPFFYTGRLDVFMKGLDLLLDGLAAAFPPAGSRRFLLTVAGGDFKGGRAVLERQVQRLGITESVHFAGALSGFDLGRLLARGCVYLHLSRYDCLPSSLTEALLAGNPAIASSAVGTASLPFFAGLPHTRIVKPCVEDAAKAISDFADCYAALRQTALAHRNEVRQFFSWETSAEQQLQHYEHLCSRVSTARHTKAA